MRRYFAAHQFHQAPMGGACRLGLANRLGADGAAYGRFRSMVVKVISRGCLGQIVMSDGDGCLIPRGWHG